MIFTSFAFVQFLLAVFCLYWLLQKKALQNSLLLAASYVFYGYVHPWFCLLIAASTVIDYLCGLGMVLPNWRKRLLAVSICANLGMLGIFKYFNFFSASFAEALASLGWQVDPLLLNVVLPVGISFYTFQTLSYTADIYRGELEPRRNFLDFALFVSFFPQLVAGPIERAKRFLPQIETPRTWDWYRFYSAWPLLVLGFFKKLVVADNLAVYVDQVFMLEQPSLAVLAAGTLGFALQIVADFSAYTDIARGTARLLGFELIENFNAPYTAISPSDFWRRWHISFSSWIRDYIYIPLGGSKVSSPLQYSLVVLATMGLSGLWHGAAWNFVAWGIFHALLLLGYRGLGLSGRWEPQTWLTKCVAWAAMFSFTLIGWSLFRAPSLGWLANAAGGFSWNATALGLAGDQGIAAAFIVCICLVYAVPLLVARLLEEHFPQAMWLHALGRAYLLAAIVIFARENPSDFIYFQF